jgi:hypothetical protein
MRHGGGYSHTSILNERVPATRPTRPLRGAVVNDMLLLLANHSRGIIQERSIDPDARNSAKRVA